jgi:ABC-type transport system substrate-binding protein
MTGAPEAVADPPSGTTLHRNDSVEDREVFLLMNQLREPFDDPDVRRALVLATDKQQIVDTVAGGLYQTAQGIWSPDSPWYVDTDYPDYDPDAAAELVAEIEEERGEPLQVTVSGPPWSIVLEGSQLLKEQWEAVGIEVELETLELSQYITTTVSGNYDVAIWQFHGAAHPDGEFVFLHSQYAAPVNEIGLNFARNVDPEIDEALLEARYTEDEERLRELYGTVQTEFADDLPYVFLWHVDDAILTSDQVHGLADWTMPDGSAGAGLFQARHRFHQVWIEN